MGDDYHREFEFSLYRQRLSALLVPLANIIKSAEGGWHAVFVVTAIMNFLVVALALVVLKPLRSRQLAGGASHAAASAPVVSIIIPGA